MPLASSVFFGGGTPSLIDAENLVAILSEIAVEDDAEVTVECNPDTVDAEKFAIYADGGVNRVSLGAQSFSPHVLRSLNRTHDISNVQRSVESAHVAGIDRVSLDLIYGTPGESADDWRHSLKVVTDLDVEHVSAYALTVETGTPLGKAVASGEAAAPDDDDQADKYLIADDFLVEHGFENSELSNWAIPGGESRHNILYWTMGEYVAIGCAGHGHVGSERWWNVRTPERYIERIGAAESPVAGSESLDPHRRAEEAFGLALRLRTGVAISDTAADCVAELVDAGLVARVRSGIRLTQSGRLLANDVTTRLLLAGATTVS